MKKNILFILNNLNCGGAEKSLISILNSIDYGKYNVDLFLFKHEGIFLSKVPDEVNLLPEPVNYQYFDMPIKKSISELVKKGKLRVALNRIRLGYFAKTEKNGSVIEQKIWRYLSNSLEKLHKEYDVAIGYQEKSPIYFCIDLVNAKKKLGWIHTDYRKLGVNQYIDQRYFQHLDYLITVSDELENQIKEIFPEHGEKMRCIHNIISTSMIRSLSLEKANFMDEYNNQISIVSVGRLAKEKGLDLSLDAIEILVKKGYVVTWFLIGEGNMRGELEKRIKEKNLDNNVVLLGVKDNPYPYIKHSDIYIQTSRFEGKSIAIEEAKVLAKPILLTNFSTAGNHIIHGETGLISHMDPISIAENLEKLIVNRDLINSFSENLQERNYGTEDEINKLYELIEA
ncbi:glycosyltransferase [Bacillus sp. 1P10SD]|uniref:glycosyltransferase n=1 Tax=Bacillus sp. 1P10SD TaxID=3132265 RepID=UPI0039A64F0D